MALAEMMLQCSEQLSASESAKHGCPLQLAQKPSLRWTSAQSEMLTANSAVLNGMQAPTPHH